jgi:hypothetical protein
MVLDCKNYQENDRFSMLWPEARRNRRTTAPAKPKASWPSPESRTLLRDLLRKSGFSYEAITWQVIC